jgi:hypothetical protein
LESNGLLIPADHHPLPLAWRRSLMHHAYIDESGTLDHQEVMTVALVVVEGAYSAQSIHKEAIRALNPKWFTKSRQSTNIQLHYADMLKDHKLSVGKVFGQKPIDCFISCFYHDGNLKSGEERHGIYTQLVKSCLIQAYDVYNDLVIVVEKQGGADSYKAALMAVLNVIPELFRKRGRFCTGKFELKSGSRPGLQLADFYAGATRDFLLAHKDRSLSNAYELVKHQIREIKIESY